MIGFHRLLIGAAGIFFLMFGILEGMLWYTGRGGGLEIALAVGSVVASALLGYYLLHLERFLGRRIVQAPPDHGGA